MRSQLRLLAKSTKVLATGLCLVLSLTHGTVFAGPAPEMPLLTAGQSATLLPDGRWLLLGGQEGDGPTDTAQLKDMVTGESVTLPTRLNVPRSGHTATLLPDGTVLIFGGVGPSGTVVREAERFDPQRLEFGVLPDTGLISRARHTATVLTDGRVLIAGGLSERGTTLHQADLWNPRTARAESFTANLVEPRSGHAAALLPSEPVLIFGGRDSAGNPAATQETYDPQAQRFSAVDGIPAATAAMPQVEATLPANDASDVPIDALIAVRFSARLAVKTLSADTVTLMGPNGTVPATVVPLEGGLLLFVTPKADLQPAANYSLFVNGAEDAAGNRLPFSAFGFSTIALRSDRPGTSGSEQRSNASTSSSDAPQSGQAAESTKLITASGLAEGEVWTPGPEQMRGDWRARRTDPALLKLPPLTAAPGVTALAGQVLRLDGEALVNATLRIGDKTARSDNTGRFLLADLAVGPQVLFVDGTSANVPGRTYGVFEIKVQIARAGETQALPYTIWMSRINVQHAVKIESPTTSETVVTSPHIPGLELRIPPGIVIRDRAGHVVTQVSITPIPVDRAPFPLPTSHVPVYFTIQPGASHLQGIDPASARGARLIYPNYTSQPPATRLDFWVYDPVAKGWHVYGQGQVSANGQHVIPDPGVAIYEFTGAMVSSPSFAPALGPPARPGRGGPPKKGNGKGDPESGNGDPEDADDGGDGGDPGDGREPCEGGGGGGDSPCPAEDGEPVDLATGLFVTQQTDLYLPDTWPLVLKRTYRQGDTRSRAFGIGASHPYDVFMVGDMSPYTYQELILEDGGRVRFNRVSPGTGWVDAVYENASTPGKFFGATLLWASNPGGTWTLKLRDGTVYGFPESAGASSPQRAALRYVRDRNGNEILFERDASANLTRITSPHGRYIQLTYVNNRITQARDNIGRTVTYTYDSSGRLSTVTNAAGEVKEYTYDTQHRMLTLKDPRGIVYLTNEYDANGRVIKQTQADSGIYEFAYTVDASGRITQTEVTNPRGKVRRVTFNTSGYPMSDTRALGTPEQQVFTYERAPASNLLLAVTDPLGRRTERTYDAKGNVLTVTHLAGTAAAITYSYTYEPLHNRLAGATDPLNRTTTFTNDSWGNLVRITNPMGHETHISHDTRGRVTSVTNPLNQTTSLTYDGGDLYSVTDALGRTSTRFTDSAGRILAVTDALGRRNEYTYDAVDRLVRSTDPLGGESHFAYDPNGKLISVTDPKGGATTFTYNNKERVATRTDALNQVESYAYDLMDRPTQQTDRNGQISTFAYDALNRPSQATYVGATVTYTYDAASRLTQIADSASGTIARSYDGLDRLTSETTAQGTVSYTYDAVSRRTSMTVGGQSTVTYGYDAADRLTSISKGSETVSFTYDAAGRAATLTLPNTIVATYSYDNAGQLIGISYTKGAVLIGDFTYEYDQAGQRIQMGGSLARMALPQTLTTAVYNAANQLTEWAGTALTYDANGNLLTHGGKSYIWDSRNRLIALAGGITASFAYDAIGRRSSKTIAGTSTAFLYDGLNPVQELVGGAPSANILAGLNVDEFFARSTSSGSDSFLTDALGSVVALSDTAGTVQVQYGYEPYGSTIQSGSANDNSYQYTGRESDGTGLYYYRARYYDPIVKRFISEDPIGLSGGLNSYAYVGGNPVSLVDPDGKIAKLLEKLFGKKSKALKPPKTRKPCPGTDKQFGDKFGDHMDPNRPGYRTHDEYRKLADDLYNDPTAQRKTMPSGETHITKDGNLLRLDPSGNFRSLYPTN
jgi:RHS repeat-associated protein